MTEQIKQQALENMKQTQPEFVYRDYNNKGAEIYNVSKCDACGNTDTVEHTSDVGYCSECGTPENYCDIWVDDEGNEVPDDDYLMTLSFISRDALRRSIANIYVAAYVAPNVQFQAEVDKLERSL